MVWRLAIYGLNLFCLLNSRALATEWANKMFDTREHDFRVVARGAEAVFDFNLTNIYVEDVHIASVRSSCGCTSPTVVKDTLKTWDKGTIRAKFNTRSFTGKKSATITVVFDQPFPAEVQLNVSGYIRSDVVFHPGYVNFGEVAHGTTAHRSILVRYAGRNSWKIMKVETPAEHYRVQMTELQRGEGRVDYQLDVELTNGMQPGYFAELFLLKTDDDRMVKIPLNVVGRVVSRVTVSPASLALGVLKPGEKVTKQLVVRSRNPFKVLKVSSELEGFNFKVSDMSQELHLIPVTFIAPEELGDLATTIHIETDQNSGSAEKCVATVTVRDPSED